jgi:hypothetical protein
VSLTSANGKFAGSFIPVSVNSVEILSGLQPADKVVISDMSAWDAFNRIRLE